LRPHKAVVRARRIDYSGLNRGWMTRKDRIGSG